MSHRFGFHYDAASNLTCVEDPDGGLTYYEYDLASRMTAVKNPFGEVTYFDYGPGGRVQRKVLGNGALTYFQYAPPGRVTDIDHRKSDMSVLATLQYDYDAVGNPTRITREDGSATYYDYDDIYQLTGETQVGSGGVEYAFEYDYDGAHNRTVKVVDGVPTYYTYNEANELLTETTGGETTYYHYDGRGNTVAKQEPSGTTYYAYNTENLMTRIDFAAGGSSYYDYDADSKRVSQRTADGFRQFVYQGPDMLRLQLERDESEETIAHYTMGSGLEAMRRSGASSFYHHNHLGTTLALTGADEAVTDTYRHDAWGVLLASTGSTVNPHTYVGRERYYRMPNAAMYHLGFRDYAQGVGRFTTVDPLRLRYRYNYVRNSTVQSLDPHGLRFRRLEPGEKVPSIGELLPIDDIMDDIADFLFPPPPPWQPCDVADTCEEWRDWCWDRYQDHLNQSRLALENCIDSCPKDLHKQCSEYQQGTAEWMVCMAFYYWIKKNCQLLCWERYAADVAVDTDLYSRCLLQWSGDGRVCR